MQVDELAALVARPDVHRKLVGEYSGPYSLGVTELASGDAAFLLRVEGSGARIPPQIDVDGHRIAVVVEGGFRPPTKQS